MNIKQELEDNVENMALSLASDFFPGPVQTVINDYLNGITLKLGSQGSLAVKPVGKTITLEMTPVKVAGSPTKATVTVSGTDNLAGASIVATFSKEDADVSMHLAVDMGDELTWKISDIWPRLTLAPFSDLALTHGSLTLKPSLPIDFTGKGDLDYQGHTLASAALRVVHSKDDGIGFLAGVVVPLWSPGSIWSPLKVLQFTDSGLFFCSIAPAARQLSDLVPPGEVPAILDSTHQLKAGVSFFTTLSLDKGPLKGLSKFLGNVDFSLFANVSIAGDAYMSANLSGGAWDKGQFTFDGFTLDWDLQTKAVSVSTAGSFHVSSDQSLSLKLTGAIQPEQAETQLTLEIDDWEHPFGCERLVIKQFLVGVEIQAQVELVLEGDFQFAADDGNVFEFAVGGVFDPEVFGLPTALSFQLKDDSPGQMLSLGDMINGVTSIDVEDIPVMEVIDEILKIKNLYFGTVEAGALDGHGPGSFWIDSDFMLFDKYEEKLVIDIEGKGANSSFTGEAATEEAIKLPASSGGLLTIARYDDETKQPDETKGPMLFVSSKPKNVGDIQDAYFYTSAYMKFLDVITGEIYGFAAKENGNYVFQFTESVQAGDSHDSSGAWAGEQITVSLDTKEIAFSAGFKFNFGWKKVSLGPLKIFGVDLIPKIPLPNFNVVADCSIAANLAEGHFHLRCELVFDFMTIHFNPSFAINLDLPAAPATLQAVGDEIWVWIKGEIARLIEGSLHNIRQFTRWVKKNWRIFKHEVRKVARAAWNGFKRLFNDNKRDFALAFAPLLKEIGYTHQEVHDGLVEGVGLAPEEAQAIVAAAFNEG